MKSARVLLKPTATCLPDITQQRNICGNPTNGHKLNLSTSTYLIPFQEEQKSAKQSRRIIKSAEDSLSPENKRTRGLVGLSIKCRLNLNHQVQNWLLECEINGIKKLNVYAQTNFYSL